MMPIRRAILNNNDDLVKVLVKAMESQAKVSGIVCMDHEMLSMIIANRISLQNINDHQTLTLEERPPFDPT